MRCESSSWCIFRHGYQLSWKREVQVCITEGDSKFVAMEAVLQQRCF